MPTFTPEKATRETPIDVPSIPEQPRPARHPLPDYLKAAGIVGVVLLHADAFGAPLFRFAVPVFIGIWALYLERSLIRHRSAPAGETSPILQRAIDMAVPFTAWTVFYMFYFNGIAGLGAMPVHTVILGQLGGYAFPGQYFFIVLFQLCGVFALLSKAVTRRTTVPLVVAFAAFDWAVLYVLGDVPAVSKIGYRFGIYWLPYVVFGIGLARGYIAPSIVPRLSALPLIALIPFELSFHGELGDYLAISVSLASLALLWSCARDDERETPAPPRLSGPARAFDRGARYLGRNSYPIFLSNPLFLSMAGVETATPITRYVITVLAVCGGLLVGETFRRLHLGPLVGTRVSGAVIILRPIR